MMKKIVILVFSFVLVGCMSNSVKKGDYSKTYMFFKSFDTSHYYVTFWDRNSSMNDDTKITMARDGDKYYYEFDGYEDKIVIQKDGKRYNVNASKNEYFASEAEVEDFASGILPSDVKKLKKSDYETGFEKVYGKKYIFEKFEDGSNVTTYYFQGDKLIYIRYVSIQNTVLLRFDYMKSEFSPDIFEIDEKFLEITY